MIPKIVLSLILLTVSNFAQSAMVSIDPVSQTANVGDEVSISLIGKDFAQTIEGGGINLNFDPAVLQLKNVAVNTQTWEFSTTSGEIDNTLGKLNDLTFSSFAGRSGNFPIAQITFLALGVGTSPLTLSESSLNPFASGGELLNPAVTFTSAEIKVVPLPGALLLLFTGLGSFFVFGKRSKINGVRL
jgi:hypothetical protein